MNIAIQKRQTAEKLPEKAGRDKVITICMKWKLIEWTRWCIPFWTCSYFVFGNDMSGLIGHHFHLSSTASQRRICLRFATDCRLFRHSSESLSHNCILCALYNSNDAETTAARFSLGRCVCTHSYLLQLLSKWLRLPDSFITGYTYRLLFLTPLLWLGFILWPMYRELYILNRYSPTASLVASRPSTNFSIAIHHREIASIFKTNEPIHFQFTSK